MTIFRQFPSCSGVVRILLEMLLAAFCVEVPRRSLDLALVSYSFVEDTITQERGSVRVGYLLFFLYFFFCCIYLFNIRWH